MNTSLSTKSAASSAEQALEAGRGMANDAIDRANSKVREFRDSVDPVIDRFASKAQDYANRGLSAASDASDAARRRANYYAEATTRYVTEEPVRAVLIAVAAGVAIAAILIATRSRDRY